MASSLSGNRVARVEAVAVGTLTRAGTRSLSSGTLCSVGSSWPRPARSVYPVPTVRKQMMDAWACLVIV